MSGLFRLVGLVVCGWTLAVGGALLGAPGVPAGGVVAFQRVAADAQTDIYAVDVGTRLVVQLTHTPNNDRFPSWSPDGAWLAVQSYRPDLLQRGESIYKIPFSTRETAEALLPDTYIAVQPDWSPDGCCLAFSAYDNSTYSNNVHILRLADGRVWNAAPVLGLSQFSPAWSPDGRAIAAAAGAVDGYLEQRIVVFAVDPTAGRPVGRRGVPQMLTASPRNAHITPAWSPDGATLVFAQLSPGAGDGQLFQAAVPIPELDGRNPFSVTWTHTPRRATYPDVSPDGEWIVYSAMDRRDTRSTVLYISRSDGADLRQLTFSTDDAVQDTAPAWRPVRRTR